MGDYDKKLYPLFDEDYPNECCQGDMPGCSCACPFMVNVRDFISKYKRGSIDAAVKTFRDAVIFPRIVAALCPGYCEKRCPRGLVDSSINLHGLEQAAVKLARSLDPINFNVPAKPQKVAIIGAGVSGMACAIRMASKKYSVTVFEKSGRIGGHLWDELPEEVFMSDFETQGKYVTYDLQLNHEIRSLDEVKDFDVVYIATGKGGNDFGLTADEDSNPSGGPDGVFIGGSVLGADTMWAIVQAANSAYNMIKYMMTGFMHFPPEHPRVSRIEMQPELIEPMERVEPADGEGYTKQEAVAEAQRCIRCDCDRCLQNCEFMQYWRLYPKQIGNFMAFGLGDMNLEPKSHNRMTNACMDCGVCERVCPAHIENGDQMMAVRRKMFTKQMIPPAYHFYWVNDMDEAAGENAYLRLPSPDGPAKYLFFPGCQLGASDPRYPKALYDLLRQAEPATALLMTCCGAPAYWAGDEEKHQEMLDRVRQVWLELGKPTLVCACLTCLRLIRRFAPDITCVSLYKVLAESDLALPRYPDKEYALVDPCAAKFDATAREDVTALLTKMGVKAEPLYEDINKMPCCGFGGNVYGADPDMARSIRQKRIDADDRPYITYCANCRDIFAGGGKEAIHLLELMTELQPEGGRPAPHISERRANRIKAKALLEGKEAVMPKPLFELDIPEQVQARMDENLIYEEDVCKVIDYAEKNNSKFVDDEGVSIGHLAIGLPTIWVEYTEVGPGHYALRDCYSHRMTVIEPDRSYEDCINNVITNTEDYHGQAE